MKKFISSIWLRLSVGRNWRPDAVDGRMVRYAGGGLEYRPMTADEMRESEWWYAIR